MQTVWLWLQRAYNLVEGIKYAHPCAYTHTHARAHTHQNKGWGNPGYRERVTEDIQESSLEEKNDGL